jgi:hypothetical protein
VWWDGRQCSLVEVYRRFKGSCCLHHQDVGGCKHLWNIGKLLRDYTAQQSWRQSPAWGKMQRSECHNHSEYIRDKRSWMFFCDVKFVCVIALLSRLKSYTNFRLHLQTKKIGNRFCEACYFKLIFWPQSRVTCCCLIHSITGVAMLNMSRYYHCSRDDSQVCASDGRFMLLKRGILFSAANVIF